VNTAHGTPGPPNPDVVKVQQITGTPTAIRRVV
jgi:hypothetical protein